MNQNIRKVALVATALTSIAALSVACGSKKSSDGGNPSTLSPATKPDGTTPSNFACNGSFADPASTGATVNMPIHTVEQPLSGAFPDLAGARVAIFDTATGTTTGVFAITSAGGLGTLAVTDSTRTSYKITHDPTASIYIDTYQFDDLTPAVGATSTAVTFRAIPSTIYSAFIGLAGRAPADVTGLTQFAAGTTDCDGDAVKNLVVDGLALCKDDLHAVPCVAYFSNGTPNANAKATDASGQIVVVGLTPGVVTTIKVKGVITAGAAETDVGTISINGSPDAVALGVTHPL